MTTRTVSILGAGAMETVFASKFFELGSPLYFPGSSWGTLRPSRISWVDRQQPTLSSRASGGRGGWDRRKASTCTFFIYGGTVQQAAINLLSDKAWAADLVHGDISRGLAALNAPAHDFLTELTQQVMSGQAEDAMASWKPEVKSKGGRDSRVKTAPSMAEVVLALARKHDVWTSTGSVRT